MNPAIQTSPLLAISPLALPVVAPVAAGPAGAIDFGELLLAQPAGQAPVAQVAPAPKPPEIKPVTIAPASVQQPAKAISDPKLPVPATLPALSKLEEPAAIEEQAPEPVVAAPVDQALPPPPALPVVAMVQPAPIQAVQTKGLDYEHIKRAGLAEPVAPFAQFNPVKPDVAPPTPIEIVAAPVFAVVEAVDAALPALRPEAADPVVQVSERVLDVARGNAWLDQLAGDIIAAQNDARDLSFRLIPPQLGQLDVRIERLDTGLQLDFAAQTEEAAQIVAAAQPRLVEELRGQGVRVAGSEVATSAGQNSNGGQQQRQPQQPETQHRKFKQPERSDQSGRFA